MSIHSTLTGTDLHESKGAAAAAANTVAVADGLGSATWKGLPVAAIDPTGFKNLNKTVLYVPFFNIPSQANSPITQYLIYVPFACTVTSMSLLVAAAGNANGTSTIVVNNSGVGNLTTFTLSGLASNGQVITQIPINNNVVAGGIIDTTISYVNSTTNTTLPSCTIALSVTYV